MFVGLIVVFREEIFASGATIHGPCCFSSTLTLVPTLHEGTNLKSVGKVVDFRRLEIEQVLNTTVREAELMMEAFKQSSESGPRAVGKQGECSDYNEHCGFWVDNGLCTSKQELMRLECPRMCKFCEAPPVTTTTAGKKGKRGGGFFRNSINSNMKQPKLRKLLTKVE